MLPFRYLALLLARFHRSLFDRFGDGGIAFLGQERFLCIPACQIICPSEREGNSRMKTRPLYCSNLAERLKDFAQNRLRLGRKANAPAVSAHLAPESLVSISTDSQYGENVRPADYT